MLSGFIPLELPLHRLLVPLLVLSGLVGSAQTPMEPVGPGRDGRMVLPVNQALTPAGRQVPLPGLRPLVLALSPDGRSLAVSGGNHDLLLLDPVSGEVQQRIALATAEGEEPHPEAPSALILRPDPDAQASYTGLAFSPDGRRLYLSDVNGTVKVFAVDETGSARRLFSVPLPGSGAPRREEEIPAGLALSADGRRLYVALNLSNRLGEFDAATGRLLRTYDVGVAPYAVVLARGKAYVSNWGGRRPGPADLVGPAGRGTTVRADARGVASEGSVSILDLARGVPLTEVLTGAHASALAVDPKERYVVCANAAADTLSVIDTKQDRVVETIWAKPSPADLFGASPNALAFDAKGRTLFVANGTQNAVAVIRFDPADRESKLLGLIPVGWFPGALAFDARRDTLCVANLKGLPAEREPAKSGVGSGFNSHQSAGSLSLVLLPSTEALQAMTAQVGLNLRRDEIQRALQPPRPGQPPRPLPERIGEPSLLKHVVYVIKENRTYDQVFGDLPQGNGAPDLCVFGEAVTPNQHQLARDFVLLDNTYCSGILSADGHQWSTSAFGTDYLEKSFAGWPRSYPDGMDVDEVDALAYAPTGFLWDNALSHGRTLRNFGEFALPKVRWTDPQRAGKPAWSDGWREYLQGPGELSIGSEPGLESLRPHLAAQSVGWSEVVPDVWRARAFIEELEACERTGRFPDLTLICLPADHTAATAAGHPTPEACVADNDLALGRIVEALSHSSFWKEMAIFVIEDDPQAGWDHVSGYRTIAQVISPYTRRGAVVSAQYNTTSLLRTIEQILGLPPMNQFDASASPMFECFTDQPNFAPFVARPNRVPLDRMNPGPKALDDPLLKKQAQESARFDFSKPDACPEDRLNRILWHAMKGSATPYPEWAVSPVKDDD